MICLAVIRGVDNHFYGFYKREAFVDFCKNSRKTTGESEILVILQGGSHEKLHFEEILGRKWIMET